MSNEKISSLELISAISEQSGTTKKVATAFMKQFTETVEEALLRDGIVKIKGFGTYKIIWNESRSSINVNTGERYEIAGHNKITFTPDDEVSDIVNTPYAHLEPIDLEGNSLDKPAELPEEDPHMKRFSEQASEIVNMIADMQAFKPKKKTKAEPTLESKTIEPKAVVTENTYIEPVTKYTELQSEDAKQEEITIQQPATTPTEAPQSAIESIKPEPVSVAPVESASIPVAPVVAEKKEEPVTSQTKHDLSSAAVVAESKLIEQMVAQPQKKSYKWLYICIITLILLTGAAIAIYFFYPELFSQTPVQKPVIAKTITKPVPVAQPPVTPQADSIERPKANPVHEATPEPQKDVFATPRVYKEFIATETASEGTWLTMLSLKYYGHKLFWVYIYEANKDKLHNPGVLPPGTKIRIPKLDSRLIDKHNGQCFRQASELQTLYTTKN